MTTTPLGRHHPRLKVIRKALRAGELTPDGLLPVEGPRLVEEARQSGLAIPEMFGVETALESGCPADRCYTVAESLLRSVAVTEEPQGLIALVRPPQFDLEPMLEQQSGAALIVVLCGLQDPGNVGTILRLCEAFGASGCIATAGTAGRYNSKVIRASAGSAFRLPHVWGADLPILAPKLESSGFQLIGTGADGETGVESPDWARPTALLIGNEGAGLAAQHRKYCSGVVQIPLSPWVESLNAAMAAAVILYEAQRHRREVTP